MPRKPRKQSFSFPQKDQPTDEQLDSVNRGESREEFERDRFGTSGFDAEKTRKENERKKVAAQVIKDIPQIFTPEQVVWVFDVYVGISCFIFSVLLKTEFKLIYEELKLDEDIKLVWAKPLAKIASKYAPSEWAGMTAEIQLVASVGIWTAAAFGRAKNVAEKQRKEKEIERKQNQRSSVTAMAQPV